MRQLLTTFQAVRAHRLGAGIVAAALVAAPQGVSAQEEWPSETVEVASHASPGGGTDTTIRMWLPAAQEMVEEDIVVVYKQGGGAHAAQQYMTSRPADGHTILAITQTHLYTIARGGPIDIDDLIGVARAMDDPSVIVVRDDSPYQTYEELVEASKEQPLTWGVAQIGGTEHIGIARWAEAAGVEVQVVPFGSGGEMITALRSGAVDATLANVSEAIIPIQEGDLHPLAVLAEERVEDLSEVPTASELGHDVSVSTTRGYAVDADTPPEVVKQIEQLLLEAMNTERFHEYLRNSGLNPETNIAGMEVWDEQLKEEYQTSLQAMKDLDLIEAEN